MSRKVLVVDDEAPISGEDGEMPDTVTGQELGQGASTEQTV